MDDTLASTSSDPSPPVSGESESPKPVDSQGHGGGEPQLPPPDLKISGFAFAVTQDWVVSNYGVETWNEITSAMRSKFHDSVPEGGFYFSSQMYTLASLLILCKFCSVLLQMTIEEVLENAGAWFVFYLRNHHAYRTMIETLGNSFPEALRNLNKAHSMVRATSPVTSYTPSIWITDEKPNSLLVHYLPGAEERRQLFRSVMKGALKSVAEVLFKLKEVTVVHMNYDERSGKELFFVSWKDESSSKETKSSISVNQKEPYIPTFSPTAQVFASVFPFHVVFELPSKKIVHYGPSIKTILPSLTNQINVDDMFTMTAPTNSTFDNILSNSDEVYVMNACRDGMVITFSGQMIINPTAEQSKSSPDDIDDESSDSQITTVLFLGWPVCKDAGLASQYGISPHDYPIHAMSVSPFLYSLHNEHSKFDYQRLLTELKETKRTTSSTSSQKTSSSSTSSKSKESKKEEKDIKTSIKNILSFSKKSDPGDKSSKKLPLSPHAASPLSARGSSSSHQSAHGTSIAEDEFIQNLRSGHFQDTPFEDSNSVQRMMLYNQLRYGDIVSRERALKWVVNSMQKNILTRSSAKSEERELGAFRQKSLISELVENQCFLILHESVADAQVQEIHNSVSWEQIVLVQKLASGAAATVHNAIYKGTAVAVKVLKSKMKEDIAELRAEAFFMSAMDHPNLMHCMGANFELEDKGPFLVFPLMKCTLWDYIHSKKFPNKQRAHRLLIALGIAKALHYLHTFPILHRDLKSPNVLIDDHYQAKLTDLGLARIESDKLMTKHVGTPLWMAPEVTTGDYGSPADVYSFAIILWEIMTLQEPYLKMQSHEVLALVKKGGRPDIPKNITPEDAPFFKLAQQCWHQQPHKRLVMSVVVDELQKLCIC